MKKRDFSELNEQETLALAITLEEEDSRTYSDFAEVLQQNFPDSAKIFAEMAVQENDHRRRLLELYRSKFGDHIPYIRRSDVKGFVERESVWMMPVMNVEKFRERGAMMEIETQRFYRAAAATTTDVSIRKLLGDLAAEEELHEKTANRLESDHIPEAVAHKEKLMAKKLFLLQIVQPGLAGLMDGSVSTLAPIFAAAFSTHDSWNTFLVGLAASLGAGISMGITEAASDDGSLTGRGSPWLRGIICGLMTTAGGLGHTLPYLIPNFKIATGVAIAFVLVELLIIAWVRKRYMDTPFLSAMFQVVVGGIIVLVVGIVIGSS
ncbi:MAG: ferritin family protein [Candidatus Pacebacteria bacterium]|nr:ferritin family protein [Candidatus Paceibacterota bacterium]